MFKYNKATNKCNKCGHNLSPDYIKVTVNRINHHGSKEDVNYYCDLKCYEYMFKAKFARDFMDGFGGTR